MVDDHPVHAPGAAERDCVKDAETETGSAPAIFRERVAKETNQVPMAGKYVRLRSRRIRTRRILSRQQRRTRRTEGVYSRRSRSLAMHARNKPALRAPGMRRHQLRRFDFYSMDRTGARLRRAAKLIVVFPALVALRICRVSQRAVRLLLQLRQRGLGRSRRFQRFARNRINVVSPSNERHVPSQCEKSKCIGKVKRDRVKEVV
jgi:hypothetical protein